MDNVIRTTYVNIWTAPGLLGGPTRAHSSVEYATAQDAIVGRTIAPDPSFALLGTLDLRPDRGQPRFIAYDALAARAEAEHRDEAA